MMEKNFSSTILKVDGVKFQNVSWIFFLFAGSLQKGSYKVNCEYFIGEIRPHGEKFSLKKNINLFQSFILRELLSCDYKKFIKFLKSSLVTCIFLILEQTSLSKLPFLSCSKQRIPSSSKAQTFSMPSRKSLFVNFSLLKSLLDLTRIVSDSSWSRRPRYLLLPG